MATLQTSDTHALQAAQQLTMDGLPRKRKSKPQPKPGGGRWQRELHQQIQVIAWARKNAVRYPCLAWLHHCPNGFARSKREAAILQKAGVTRGIADLFLPFPANGRAGLYLELKHGKNKLTDEQERFLTWAAGAGYATAVCYSAGAAITVIEQYLNGMTEDPQEPA